MSDEQSATPSLPQGEWLPEEDGHSVWWCEGGAPDGLPVLIVHGGPGGASRAEPTRWFSGLPVRWIAIDQRGCGRSTPRGATTRNDLPALLRDMGRLQERLGLSRWALAGGSWGARVALAWAAAHPRGVQGLFIRSPFFGSVEETRRYIAAWPDWLGDAGLAWLGEEPARVVAGLYQAATSMLNDGAIGAVMTERVAQAWSAYDDAQSAAGGVASSGARFDASRLPKGEDALLAWRVHAAYAVRGWGALDGHAVGVDAVGAVPGTLSVVWGEADSTCDPAAARALVQRVPGALGRPVAGAGHRMSEPSLASALRDAAREWVLTLSP